MTLSQGYEPIGMLLLLYYYRGCDSCDKMTVVFVHAKHSLFSTIILPLTLGLYRMTLQTIFRGMCDWKFSLVNFGKSDC